MNVLNAYIYICICVIFEYRSPPRTRRSSTSSTGSSGNGGYTGGLSLTSGGLATAKRASRRRSRSPSPRVSTVAATNKLSVDPGRRGRSRSPTPRITTNDRLTVGQNGGRSRSVTPCGDRRKQRSVSPSVTLAAAAGADRLLVPNGSGGQKSEQLYENGQRSRSPSATRRQHNSSGVDDTPTPKISLNFTSELAAEISDRLYSADRPKEPTRTSQSELSDDDGNDDDDDDDVTVDTSSTCRVSDNFRGTEQYHTLNPTPVTAIVERRHSTVREEESSEVDTTPFCRVSDSLRSGAVVHDGPPAVRKKSSHRDAKRSEPVGTDSGSEVSDEGYRSLGVVNTTSASVLLANSGEKSVHKINGKQTLKKLLNKQFKMCSYFTKYFQICLFTSMFIRVQRISHDREAFTGFYSMNKNKYVVSTFTNV